MAQEMSDIERENLRTLVHQIATHIIEGSAAVQELKSTIARLKDHRVDIEYAVSEHWLKAAKTIEAAGKDKSSWVKFINSLKINYKDDKDALRWKTPQEENNLLINASKELWRQGTTNNVETIDYGLVESVDHGYSLKSRNELLTGKNYLSEGSTFYSLNNIEQLAEAAIKIGEPSNSPRNKRKLEDSNELYDKGGRKKTYIHFKDGRKLGGEEVSALKKNGRCFYCERKGHRALDCRDNPENQR